MLPLFDQMRRAKGLFMALPELTEAQAKALAGGPFAAELLKNAVGYTVPIGWVVSGGGDEQRLSHGTAFFLRTQKKLFGITARHVVDGFLAAKAAKTSTTCHLMDEPFPLDRAIVGLGARADIATFRVSEQLISKLGKRPCTAWPPMMPEVGKGMIWAGYPGVERIQTGFQQHNFGIYCAGTLAHSVSDTRISSAPLRRDEVLDTMGLGLPSEMYDLGGMSGAPVLTLIETGVVSWRLAGVISEGMRVGHVFWAARADFIDDDGNVQ
jgi:hypothetical protein